MKTASVTDIRCNFHRIERELAAGRAVKITKRGRVIARLVPERSRPELPDFMARLRAIYGDKQAAGSGAELIQAEREGR